jgi:hypothetical protein
MDGLGYVLFCGMLVVGAVVAMYAVVDAILT